VPKLNLRSLTVQKGPLWLVRGGLPSGTCGNPPAMARISLAWHYLALVLLEEV